MPGDIALFCLGQRVTKAVDRLEGIVGMAEGEALALLDVLLENATQPRYEYRHRWLPGDTSVRLPSIDLANGPEQTACAGSRVWFMPGMSRQGPLAVAAYRNANSW